jgi:tRNA dimethylallyltransferase
MLEAGLVEEVQTLRQRYRLHAGLPSMRCVGYRQVWQMLEGEIAGDDLRNRGVFATRQFAKRQLTWVRAMPDVEVVDCLNVQALADLPKRCEDFLSGSAHG